MSTQEEAIALVKSGKNCYIGGGAGRGKSWVIRQITDKNTVLCAPTGIAALNVGGITCHRAFGLPFGLPTPDDHFKISAKVKKLLSNKNLKRVILDECFKGDVEILTEKGFVRFDSYTDNLEVAQFNADTKGISFTKPQRFVNKHYDGDMVHLKSDNKVDLTCTAGHDLLFYKRNGSPLKQKASNKIPTSLKMMSSGIATGESGCLSLYEKLCIAHQADGNQSVKEYSLRVKDVKMTETRWGFTPKGGCGSTHVTVFKGRKKAQIESDFGEIIASVSEEKREGYTTYHIPNIPSKFVTKNFWEAFDIKEFSFSKAKEFIEYVSLWDGHVTPSGAITYSNTNKESADFVQAVACLGGYRASITKIVDERSDTYLDSYKVHISKTLDSITMQKVDKKVETFNGKVYCVTVPDGNIIVRSGRNIHVVGNCGMVRADMLDLIDSRLKLARGNNLPFGGVQVVVVGDFYQLAPIVTSRERSMFYENYDTAFAFGAGCWEFEHIELEHAYRQSNKTHVKVLDTLRKGGKWSWRAFEWLEENTLPYDEAGENMLHLCCYKEDAARINAQHYAAIEAPERTYKGSTNATKWSNDLTVPQLIKLKVGAKVIIRANDPEGDYTNGMRGVVKALYATTAVVTLDDSGEDVTVQEFTWETYAYKPTAKGIEKIVEFVYSQIPLQLGWAVTIHSSQGMTLDEYALDVGRGCFTVGQFYVAISRARDLSKICLASPIGLRDLQVSEEVRAFYGDVI